MPLSCYLPHLLHGCTVAAAPKLQLQLPSMMQLVARVGLLRTPRLLLTQASLCSLCQRSKGGAARTSSCGGAPRVRRARAIRAQTLSPSGWMWPLAQSHLVFWLTNQQSRTRAPPTLPHRRKAGRCPVAVTWEQPALVHRGHRHKVKSRCMPTAPWEHPARMRRVRRHQVKPRCMLPTVPWERPALMHRAHRHRVKPRCMPTTSTVEVQTALNQS